MFKGLKKGSMVKFISLLEKQRYKFKEPVYKEGEPVKYVYLVWKGDF
jgi:signal-transduction protein with cAMP-binding, CBS, and nucleotidyltransferase domain